MKLIKKIKIEYCISSIRLMLVAPVALLLRKKNDNLWLVGERPDQARDNGFCFFRYLANMHPDQKVYYVIDKDSPDYNKVQALGESIDYNSWKHYYYYCVSRVHISAHTEFCRPEGDKLSRYLKRFLAYKDVFIPHGVSYAITDFCLKKYADINLFCCCSEYERANVISNYGYSKEEAVLTGYPRLDYWFDKEANSRLILLMPTWRRYISRDASVTFEDTNYYQSFNSLINDKCLCEFLEQNDYRLVFYLHNDMRQFANHYDTSSKRIEIVLDDSKYDIQSLLKEASLLITDYSSVHFDFAYMGKPVIYYQFDQEEFYQKQYGYSGYDVEKLGFGRVAYDEQTVIDEIIQSGENGFEMKDVYYQRMLDFYYKHDTSNCERVYNAIKGIE